MDQINDIFARLVDLVDRLRGKEGCPWDREQTHESLKVTDWEGTDSIPMRHGNKLYYSSDEGGSFRRNIWSYNPQTGARSQVTRFTNYDVKTPAIGPGANGQGEIVMQVGGKLVLVDLGNGSTARVQARRAIALGDAGSLLHSLDRREEELTS